MSVTIRNYRDDDLDAIVELINAAEAVDQLDLGTSVTELRELFGEPDYHPQNNVFVAQDEAGRMVGSARLELRPSPEQSFFLTFPLVLPAWRGKGIEGLLLKRLWKGAEERRGGLRSKRVYFHACCGGHQEQLIAAYKSVGLRAMRSRPHMIHQPLENLSQSQPPRGIEVRPYIKGQDDESTVETLNEAFADDRQFVPITTERRARCLASPVFREELNLVGADGEKVVGLCTCIIDEESSRWLMRRNGYVDTLWVLPAYPRQRLGRALPLAGLHALKQAGVESATLDTDTDNPTQAMGLYDYVGFQEVWRWVDYGREMP